MKKIFFSLSIAAILLVGACQLEDEPEETYQFRATGYGADIHIVWGYRMWDDQIHYWRDSGKYHICDHSGDGWWEETLHMYEADAFELSLSISNTNGGPVLAVIKQVIGGEEIVLQDCFTIGTIEVVAEIRVPAPASSSPSPPLGTYPLETYNPNKVICVELYRQGLLAEEIYAADEAFGDYLRENHNDVLLGYHFWAKPLVALMRESPTITHLVNFFAEPWSYEMAYLMGAREKGNLAGKILMSIGVPACRIIGKVITGTVDFALVSVFLLQLLVLVMVARRFLIRLKGDTQELRGSFAMARIPGRRRA